MKDICCVVASRRASLSLSNFDSWVKRNEMKLYNQDCVKQAFKAADENGQRSIVKDEFVMLMEYLVLFCGLKEIFTGMDTNGDRRLDRREFEQAMRRLGSGSSSSTTTGGMTQDEIGRAFTAIDLDAGGSIRFSELCVWASMMLKDAKREESTAASQQQADTASAGGSRPNSPVPSGTTPGYKWTSHPELKRLLQDKTLDDMEEKTIQIECKMGARMVPLGITWQPKKSETDSLVVKAIQIYTPSPFAKELEKVTQCMILSKINAQDCRGYTKSIQALEAALKPNRRTTLEFASLELKDESAAANEGLEKVRALADVSGDQPGDLSFDAGDVIVVTAKDDSGWWKGYLVENQYGQPSNDPVEGDFFFSAEDFEEMAPESEPEPELEPEPEPQYCKTCHEVFETSQCKKSHGAKDSAGGANYISLQEAVKGRWPNAQQAAARLARTATAASSSSGGFSTGRSTPRYAGTVGPTGSTPRRPSPGSGGRKNEWEQYGPGSTDSAAMSRTTTKRGAGSPPKAVSAAKGSQYCKGCKGTFTEVKCPNNHGTWQYLPAGEATAWPGYNSPAVYGKK